MSCAKKLKWLNQLICHLGCGLGGAPLEWLKLESSNFYTGSFVSSISLVMTTYPKTCVMYGYGHMTQFKILGPIIFGMSKAQHLSFATQIDRGEY